MLWKTKGEVIEESDPSPAVVSLKEQLALALADVKKLKAQVGSDKTLFEVLRKEVQALSPYDRVPISKPKLNHADLQAVLILADPHSEELVRSEEMEGMASHDWGTHESRMSQAAEKTVEIVTIMRQASKIPNLSVYLLGDWFLGKINPDELVGTSMTMQRALPRAGIVLADTLMRMSAHFDSTRVVGIIGNHGRDTRKPVYKMAADRNWDMSAYLIAQEATRRDRRLEWTLPESLMHVDEVLGWKNLVTHGNLANITHRVPYFGIEDSFQRQRESRRGTDKDFDYAYIGHFHQEGLILRGSVMMCPSIIGREQFGQYRMHSATDPAAMLLFYSEKHGRTYTCKINLQ